ncbi:MAG: hypothetical protein IJM79_01575 [Erysipelotrichaceae bacterium]|nr:hypothetical protein [Erysipelotrichaceae bacterium]
MSDLRDFRDAIDSIEVTNQQKKKMYSNIIMKAEQKKKFSLPTLALKLSPVLSLCLIVVLAVSLGLPSFAGRKSADAFSPGDVPETIPTENDKHAYFTNDDLSCEIDGVVYYLDVHEITETSPSAHLTACSDGSDDIQPITCISWNEDNKVYRLYTFASESEENLWKLRDRIVEELLK